jgi:small subunit ribosomal protein S4e
MDVIEVVTTGEVYRLIPRDLRILVPVKTKEKGVKLVKITNKVTIKGNKTQYSFHDGKTLISEDRQMRVGDVCLVKLPNNQIENHIKFEAGCTVLVIQGENAGRIGKIEEIKNGMFSLPKRTVVNFGDRSVELPIDIVMPIGIDGPLLEVFNQ